MARRKKSTEEHETKKRRPASTPESRENQMIALAVDLAEKQLLDGTASSQVITHFLKLATAKEKLEREILESKKELMKAQTENLQAAKRIEELYSNALKAMQHYSGNDVDEEEDEDEYED
jgi:hypothetical protein